jgi:hypothetical protein
VTTTVPVEEGFWAMERYDINDHDCPCRRGVLDNGKI